MTEDTYREHLNDLQLEVEELRAKLKEAQTGDLISRAAALNALTSMAGVGNRALDKIRALPSAQPEQPKSCNECENFNKTMRLIYSAQPEPKWIPCSERLPEANGRYLVTRGLNACGSLWNRVYITNYSDLMGLKSERIWWGGNVGKSDFERIDDVIAWMPLPEPYAERRTDEL